ncbi:IS5 family transposase [Desulfoscipio gibsoniae]|uniref:IS5 family transposase n=1 Tax=Desulfoscipio gibsoniae TaxID=102134 RepID=UPI003EBBA25F
MFRKVENQYYLEEFILPFEGKLRADNRWVKLAKIIPWESIEERYANLFPSNRGQLAKPVRMALGALIIKEKCGYSDRETVEQITENPYLQYFIGLREYHDRPPFDSSLMVHFRKRFGSETLKDINEEICRAAKKAEEQKKDDDNKPKPPSGGKKTHAKEPNSPKSKASSFEVYPANKGKLILDATCAPADIRYPTDLSLLNEAREKLDNIIDLVHKTLGKPGRRPRTYRQIARKAYLNIVHNRKPGKKAIRKAIGKQLRYVRRNLSAVDRLLAMAGDSHGLSQKQQDTLRTIRMVYEQQLHMYTYRKHKINDRIVSISQPHVRPIVRGKATADVEFGAKVAISMVDGYAFVETLSWDAFNEGVTLQESVEYYRQKYGYYPEAVQADKIYRNRENLRFCDRYNIRLSGPRLGRPLIDKSLQREQRRIERQDASERNAVEAKFGEGKRRYGLARIMARLKETAESVICLQFLVMNLERRLRVLLFFFMRRLFRYNLGFQEPLLYCFN